MPDMTDASCQVRRQHNCSPGQINLAHPKSAIHRPRPCVMEFYLGDVRPSANSVTHLPSFAKLQVGAEMV